MGQLNLVDNVLLEAQKTDVIEMVPLRREGERKTSEALSMTAGK